MTRTDRMIVTVATIALLASSSAFAIIKDSPICYYSSVTDLKEIDPSRFALELNVAVTLPRDNELVNLNKNCNMRLGDIWSSDRILDPRSFRKVSIEVDAVSGSDLVDMYFDIKDSITVRRIHCNYHGKTVQDLADTLKKAGVTLIIANKNPDACDVPTHVSLNSTLVPVRAEYM